MIDKKIELYNSLKPSLNHDPPKIQMTKLLHTTAKPLVPWKIAPEYRQVPYLDTYCNGWKLITWLNRFDLVVTQCGDYKELRQSSIKPVSSFNCTSKLDSPPPNYTILLDSILQNKSWRHELMCPRADQAL